MKRIIILIVIAIAFFSCSKEDAHLNENLIGTWNWVASSGGIDGNTQTPETTKNQIILRISSDTIKYYINEDLKFSSSYKVEAKMSNIFNEQRKMIILDDVQYKMFTIIENTLILIDDCADCYTYEYQKAN